MCSQIQAENSSFESNRFNYAWIEEEENLNLQLVCSVTSEMPEVIFVQAMPLIFHIFALVLDGMSFNLLSCWQFVLFKL